MVRSGYGYQYLWPELPWIDAEFGAILYYLPALLAIVFTVHFLHLPEISKRFTRYFQILFATLTTLIILRTVDAGVPIKSLSLVVMVIYLSFVVAGVFALRKGYQYARYYLLAWVVYCFALANWLMAISEAPALLPTQSYLLLQLSFIAQILLLSTALAHRIRTLRKAQLQAEADNRAQSSFLARMSQEIRTPLSGVLGMSELLSERLTDPLAINYTDIIRSSGSSLLAIINDILDYSKFTSGKMELEKIAFNPRHLTEESLDLLRPQAQKKGLALRTEIDPATPDWVEGDPTRLKQVMLNFLSNALKFTERGSITLSIGPMANCEHMLEVAVRDTGQGIPEHEQSRLFDAFAQANSATSRQHGGTGLGLSICKQLAAMMGGEIGVRSREGEGATFWITARLPATSAAIEFRAREPQVLPTGDAVRLGSGSDALRILVVEDNHINQLVIEGILKRLGQQPDLVADGKEAVTRICGGAEYDLVLMDCEMPGVNGLTATRRIREWERQTEADHTPIVALTAHAIQSQMAACVAAGMDDCLSKPVEVERLATILGKYARDREPAQLPGIAEHA